ncbi:uncharacterized protein LOC129776700 isoform X2 [Toxorhynchites rutilus septentrionalis]|uniref:uncharacterized protein LOC129776700 isoform X2 n=1 Tax=Toxorhynchites rutilus septentrionalis TaxID=329112 RepID=UPI00247B14B8|nr:uncharacterized protein LOC129776700 isoform X2 [Toxorhynchites rutilus septentrionalis]
MHDTMPKVLDSDTESEIPVSIQNNNNSEPSTDNEEKPETESLPTGMVLPVGNGNISDTDSTASTPSNARLVVHGTTAQTTGSGLPAAAAGAAGAATAGIPQEVTNSTSLTNLNSNDSTGTIPARPSTALSGSSTTSSVINERVKKYRHQHFSKNIYIGTKNAEKWDTLRNVLQFKNDVEFVSFLLRLAEVDDRKRKNRIMNGLNGDRLHPEDESRSDVPPGVLAAGHSSGKPSTKKTKRVQFQDNVNIINDSNNSSSSLRTSGVNASGGVFDFHEDEDDNESGTGMEFRRRRMRSQQPMRSPDPPNEGDQRDEEAAAEGGDEDDEQYISQNIIKKISSRAAQGNEVQQDSISSTMGSVSEDSLHAETEVLDYRIAEKIKTELEEKQKMERKSFGEELPSTSNFSEHSDRPSDDETYDSKLDIRKVDIRKAPFDPKLGTSRKVKRETGTVGLRIEYEEQEYGPLTPDERKPLLPPPKKPRKAPTTKNKACIGCSLKHGLDPCPLNTPLAVINNKIELKEWLDQNEDLIKKHKIVLKTENPEEMDDENEDNYDDDEDDDEGDEMEENQFEEKLDIIPSFSETSLPQEFELRLAPLATTISTAPPAASSNPQLSLDVNESSSCALQPPNESLAPPPAPTATVTNTINHGLSIYTKIFIPKYTQLGPVIGQVVKETEIQDDCNMRYIFETFDGTKSTYINMENKNQANWLRYLRPARHRDQKNCVLKVRNSQIVFVTCSDLDVGSELLYWSDDTNSAWGKKKMEKTNCGGCNLKFEHSLYYRTHCSVFHDPSFSLTIRKYHCKVCGIAVLGKENIMKHAEKMHDGKGAYQCQFCQKFFLRLNYLEMHRTYGCSMNPQRARPLCDFCGRKFCQPQKLKVHIKRMHSDMAEVLRDFQCKLCSKLLGSRAALQRHSKEVHSRNSAVVSCPRCQKLFQNRSNLKIHMLTHSGVRPFKCAEGECVAAFTTKQCLQFHYKKVHGYTQEQMPKIERSVAYTFDAYSGDLIVDGIQRRQRRKLEPGEEGQHPNGEKRKRAPKEISGNILKTKNILESFSEICKNDSNLSLLSNKISSILNGNLKDFSKVPGGVTGMDGGDGVRKEELEDDLDSNDCTERDERLEAIQRHLSQPLQEEKHDDFSQLHSRLSNISSQSEPNQLHYKMSNEDDKPLADGDGFGDLNALAANHKYKEFMNGGNPGLVISKGSKKWISDNDHLQDDNNSENMLAAAANRDFITKLIMNGNVGHSSQQNHAVDDDEDDDDNSTILDVVDSNNQNQQNSSSQSQQTQQQQQHQQQQQYTSSFTGLNSSLPDLPTFQSHTFPTHFNHQSLLGSFYNNNGGVTSRNAINTIPTSASMLVEAALNSVSNIINEAEMNNSNNDQQDMHMTDIDSGNAGGNGNNLQSDSFNTSGIDGSVDDMKMLKPHNFMNSMSQFSTQSPDDASIIQERSEIEVVRPKSRDKLSAYGDGEMLGYDSQQHQQQQSQSTPHKHTPSVDSVRSAMSPEQNDFSYSNSNGAQGQPHIATNSPVRSSSRQIYGDHDLISPASTPSLPRYDFRSESNNYARRQEKTISSLALENFEANLKSNHHMQHMSSDEDSSIVIAENLSVSAANSEAKLKLNNQTSTADFLAATAGSGGSKYDTGRNTIGADLSADLRLKYNSEPNVDLPDFRSNNAMNEASDFQGLDMTSRAGLSSSYSHTNFQVPPSGPNLNFNRYHHHIYDILNEREQHQQQQQQQHQHQQQQEYQLQQQQQQQHQQQMQHMIQDHIGQDTESDQPASVDLSRTSNYLVPSPPSPAIPYSHPHPDMIRMVSLDLSSNSGSNMMVGNTPHHVRHPSFLSSQIQHSNRDSLPDHHRLLASEQLAASNHRLLVDPAAHLIFEQNNRLLAETPGPAPPPPRHVVSPQRGFGAYHHHHHHQVGTPNYHHHSVKQNLTSPPLNQHTSAAAAAANYHPFPTYY